MTEAKVIGVRDLFRQAWALYRERRALLTRIILVPVAVLVVSDLLYLFAPIGLANTVNFIGTVISLFAYLALVISLQGDLQWKEAYRAAWSRIWSYGWLTFLSGFVVLGGLVMLVVPGIIFSIWFIFGIYVFALEKEKGMNALLRSRQYVQGYWWQVFGRQIVFVIAALIALTILALIGGAIAGERGVSLLVNLFTLILVPVAITYIYTLYQSLKSLKPEVVSQPIEGPRGFFYFSAVLGVLGLVALVILLVLALAYTLLGPDIFQNDALLNESLYPLEAPE